MWDKRIRPVNGSYLKVSVDFKVFLEQVIKVDEVNWKNFFVLFKIFFLRHLFFFVDIHFVRRNKCWLQSFGFVKYGMIIASNGILKSITVYPARFEILVKISVVVCKMIVIYSSFEPRLSEFGSILTKFGNQILYYIILLLEVSLQRSQQRFKIRISKLWN